MGKAIQIVIASILILMNLFTVHGSATNELSRYPTITGVFIATSQVKDWNQQDWNQSLEKMAKLKMDTIILQYTVQERQSSKTIKYFSDSKNSSSNSEQQVEFALSAANKLNLKVYIGLQINEEEWFAKYASDTLWLQKQTKLSKEIAKQLWEKYSLKYGNTIAGWYLPFELTSGGNFDEHSEQISIVNNYLKPVSEYLKRTTGYSKNILISPLIYPSTSKEENDRLLVSWQNTLKYIIPRTKIDIVAPQDGVGWKSSTTKDLGPWFKATREAIDSANKARKQSKYYSKKSELWDNAENYNMDAGNANLPMSINLLVENIKAVDKYVDKTISFSIHRLDPIETHAGGSRNLQFYNGYYYYTLTGKTLKNNPNLQPPVSVSANLGSDHLSTHIQIKPNLDQELKSNYKQISTQTKLEETLLDSASKIVGYKIFRKEKDSKDFHQILEVPQSHEPIDLYDMQLIPGKTYNYLIKSFDAFGALSNQSKIINLQIPDTLRSKAVKNHLSNKLQNVAKSASTTISGVSYRNVKLPLANPNGLIDGYLEKYTRGDVAWLVDEKNGSGKNWWNPGWLGFQNLPRYQFEMVLPQDKNINEMTIKFLENRDVGIRLPKKVIFEIASSDSESYKLFGEAMKPTIPQDSPHKTITWTYRSIDLNKQSYKIKKIKITVEPEYYNSSWSYVDEIQLFSLN